MDDPHIVIVGGGAGGLILATRLGDRLGKHGRARITLVDQALTHVWKPLLHEVAAGTLHTGRDSIDYLAQARAHHFGFQLGRMTGLDAAAQLVHVDPVHDRNGREIAAARSISYDILVLAVGSQLNDFGIEGVNAHCLFLDSAAHAEEIQQRLLAISLGGHQRERPESEALQIAIVGAGATGVELAAELDYAFRRLAGYGLRGLNPDQPVHIALIEAADSVLPALPPRLQNVTEAALKRLGIAVHTGEIVAKVDEFTVHTRANTAIPADLSIWAAGVKAPEFLAQIDEATNNRANQIEIDPFLRVTGLKHVYALGDCAALIDPKTDRLIAPRAQAAYQQAIYLATSLVRTVTARPVKPFVYKDYGSLVSLSASTVGNLMGNLFRSVMIEGSLARLAYLSLYKKHQLALHGWLWVILTTAANILRRATAPRLKLH